MLKDHLASLETSSDIWGINPEAIFLCISDIERNANDLTHVIKLETLRTNISKDETTYRNALRWFCCYLGLLMDGNVSPLGKLILIDKNPLSMIQTCLFASDRRIRNFFTDILAKKVRFIKNSEFEVYFLGEGTTYRKILASFSFVSLRRDIAELNIPLIEETGKILEFPRAVENWLCAKSIFQALVGADNEALVSRLASELLSRLNVPFRIDDSDLTISEAIKHLGNMISELSMTIMSSQEVLLATFDKVLTDYVQANQHIKSHLDDSAPTTPQIVDISIQKLSEVSRRFRVKQEKLERLAYQLVSLSNRGPRAYLSYVERNLDLTTASSAALLADIFGDDIRIDSHFLNFRKRFSVRLNSTENLKEYWEFMLEEYARNKEKIEKLLQAKNYLSAGVVGFANVIYSNLYKVKNSLMEKALSRRFSPFYFVYTLLNPLNIGKEAIDKYVGNNRYLIRETQKLSNEWPAVKTDNAQTYIDMADKLLSKGLESDLPVKEIRIMTPYTDYELHKYVSMLRRLIMKGYTLRILCRLSADPRPWRVLKESLLKGLGEKTKSVEIRTYTRFKEFLPASKLAALNEVQRKEFGVHAKLFIIGDAEDGAILLGSANMLENSYNWNPECGIYTEDPIFIQSARAFFDFVWALSEQDALDLSRLDRIPKGPFFPHFYYT